MATDHSSRESLQWLLCQIGKLHRQAVRAHQSFSARQEPGQPFILLRLQRAKKNGETVSQNDLAQALNVSDPTITASLKSLERQGYISREPDPDDMRRKLCVLTPAGDEIATQCRQRLDYVNGLMLEGLSMEEREMLRELILRIEGNLENIIG